MTTQRIELVDALRGFAILAIVLLHNVIHFNLIIYPQEESNYMNLLNGLTWLFSIFFLSGKAYAMFALLFGFSYYIQLANRQSRGEDFSWRFAWRMVLLFCLGYVNVSFYPGDILTVYAVLGLLLIPFRKAGNRLLLMVAFFCLLQPVEWGKILYAILHPEYRQTLMAPVLLENMQSYLREGSFLQVLVYNWTQGEYYSIAWAWENGRIPQTVSLFLLGMWLGRKQLFRWSEESQRFWKKTFRISLPLFILVYACNLFLQAADLRKELLTPLQVITSSCSNTCFMFMMVSLFFSLWYKTSFQNILSKLVPYGKMSLTNYITSGILGAMIYFGYALNASPRLGAFYSLLAGLAMFGLQLLFSHLWLRKYKQGPFEKLWHKLT